MREHSKTYGSNEDFQEYLVLKEINGKIYYILIRLQIRVRGILNSNKSGPGENYGMQFLNYQTNNVSL